MRQQLVYDLPTRLFHWIFAVLFLAAFAIAKTIDDESILFTYHMLAGLTLSFLVGLRIVWGFVGTKHARFSGFSLNPKDLFAYFRGILSGDMRRWAGHNPASSWAALTMMFLALGLGVTGYLMTSTADKEVYEDLHELMANGFLVIAILHIAGVVLHTIRHKELIGLSMVHGQKENVPQQDVISSSRTPVGMLLLGLLVVFAVNLVRNYDSQTGALQFFGTTLQLAEGQEGEETSAESDSKASEIGENDEDDED